MLLVTFSHCLVFFHINTSDHPDLLKLEANRKHFEDVSSSLLKNMLEELANRIAIFGDAHNADRAYNRSRSIRNDKVHLNSPLTTIRYVQETVKDLESILSDRAGNVTEERTEKVVIDRSALLSGLIYHILQQLQQPRQLI